jgi:hypothetical protein
MSLVLTTYVDSSKLYNTYVLAIECILSYIYKIANTLIHYILCYKYTVNIMLYYKILLFNIY